MSYNTPRNSSKLSNALPVPRTTHDNGSSAKDTGKPVALRITVSKFDNIEPSDYMRLLQASTVKQLQDIVREYNIFNMNDWCFNS